MAETPEWSEEPPKKRLSDDDYVRTGRREIIIGIVLLIGGGIGYWQYAREKVPVMDHGAVQLVTKLPGNEGYAYVQGPEGTQCEVVETGKTKDGAMQVKVKVTLEEGACLKPGNYEVVVGTESGNETKAAFTVKTEQKSDSGGA